MPLTYQEMQLWFDEKNRPLSEIITTIMGNGYYADILSVREEDDETAVQNYNLVAEYLTQLFGFPNDPNYITADSESYEAGYEDLIPDAGPWLLFIRHQNARDSDDLDGKLYPIWQEGKSDEDEVDGFFLHIEAQQGQLPDHVIRILFLNTKLQEASNGDWPTFVGTFPLNTQLTIMDMADDGPEYLDQPVVLDIFMDLIVGGAKKPFIPNPLSFIINYTYRSPNRVN
jgi:hypothetical protein